MSDLIKFTPGPWEWKKYLKRAEYSIRVRYSHEVIGVTSPLKADAQLMAAAPDLITDNSSMLLELWKYVQYAKLSWEEFTDNNCRFETIAKGLGCKPEQITLEVLKELAGGDNGQT
jgi:hypothetical protein